MVKKIFIIALIVGFIISCKKDPSTTPKPVAPLITSPPTPFVLDILVYPNPCKGVFTIETNDTKPDSMQIFDINGRRILEQTIHGTTVIDIIGLLQGVYLLEINADGKRINKRLVVVN